MFFPIGSLIDGFAIALGACCGLYIGKYLVANVRTAVFQALGICIMAFGIDMVTGSTTAESPFSLIYMIISILIGVVIGELIDLDGKLMRVGDKVKKLIGSKSSNFTESFINASILFGVGSFAILAPLNEGLGNMQLIITKTILDLFTAILISTSMGIGVLFSAIPVFLIEAIVAIFAKQAEPFFTVTTLKALSATGGIAIIGIGFNLLELKQLRITNYLPAVVVVIVLCKLMEALESSGLLNFFG